MGSGNQATWRLPLRLALIGLLMIIGWNGMQMDKRAVAFPTPTRAAVPRVAEVELSPRPMAVPTQTSPPAALPTPIATFTASPSPLPTWTPFFTPTATPTATPPPTFTRPPPDNPQANEHEHYWLERPISPAYVNWTDRIYPYGSTLGGTLPPHHGVEFFNPVGVPVLAAGAGVVVTAGLDDQVLFGPQANFYGNLVIIRHEQLYQGQYLYTLYGHLSKVLASAGQPVTAGEQIGLVGGTGVADGGAHLHFEVRVAENRYETTRNPELWLKPFPGWGTIAGQLLWPDGSYVYQAPLTIRRVDDPGRFVNRTVYTYADDSVNPDDYWRENFSSPDLEPGPYELLFRNTELGLRRQELIWVYPGQTAFITIQLDAPPATP